MAFVSKKLDGLNLILSIGGTALGCSTTCGIELTRNTRDTSCKSSGAWDEFEAGTMNWTISSENFVNFGGENGYAEMFDALTAGTKVAISCEYAEDAENTFTLSGNVILTSLPLTAPRGENASFSIAGQGTGELTKTVVESV